MMIDDYIYYRKQVVMIYVRTTRPIDTNSLGLLQGFLTKSMKETTTTIKLPFPQKSGDLLLCLNFTGATARQDAESLIGFTDTIPRLSQLGFNLQEVPMQRPFFRIMSRRPVSNVHLQALGDVLIIRDLPCAATIKLPFASTEKEFLLQLDFTGDETEAQLNSVVDLMKAYTSLRDFDISMQQVRVDICYKFLLNININLFLYERSFI